MTVERSMHRAELLDRRPIPRTAGDILVGADIFLHNLDAHTLQSLRRAMEEGLMPSGLDFTGDDGSIAIIRFTRPRGEP